MQLWGLDNIVDQTNLDSACVFSSVSSLLGNPGQANYAAANAAMEEAVEGYLAEGLSISAEGWGPWAAGGMAAQTSNLLSRLQQQGHSFPRSHIGNW